MQYVHNIYQEKDNRKGRLTFNALEHISLKLDERFQTLKFIESNTNNSW
jgi:hypothetical protein